MLGYIHDNGPICARIERGENLKRGVGQNSSACCHAGYQL